MRLRISVTAEMVKAEAERRITLRYPLWQQVNIIDEGGQARIDMRKFINATRGASNRLEAMKPIPPDFAADRHWN